MVGKMRSAITRSIWRLKAILNKDFLRLLNDAAFMFIYRVSGAVLVLVTQVLLARWMGPAQLGTYVLAFSWCIFLSVVAGLGLPRAAARFIGQGLAHNRQDIVQGYIRRQKQIGLGVGLAIAAIASSILVATGKSGIGTGHSAFLLAFLAIPIFTMINVYGSVALAMSWFRTATVPNSLLRPALLLAAIAIVWYRTQTLSADSVMFLHVVVALLVVTFQARAIGRRLSNQFSTVEPSYEQRLWTRTALSLLIGSLFVNYFQEVNIITVGTYVNADQLAVYNVSLRIAFLISFGIQAVNAIAMPRTAHFHAKADKQALQNHVTHVARLQFVWSLSAVILVIVFGKFALSIFGQSFIIGYHALIILSVAQLLSSIFGPVIQVMSMTGHHDDCLYVFASALLTMLVLNHVLIDAYGINGAAIAVAFTFLLQSAWLYVLAMRRLDIHASAFSLRTGPD